MLLVVSRVSGDSGRARRYVARLGKGSISVYELPDMTLLDKRSHKLEGVQDFAWSPAQPILCAYQTEQAGGNLPARISLIAFPDKRELRQKNLFSVSGAATGFQSFRFERSRVWPYMQPAVHPSVSLQ